MAAGVYGTALIHIEGAFEESTSVRLFHPPLPIYIWVSVSLFLSLSLCVCLYLSKNVLLHSTIHFLFFSLFSTCPLRYSPPPPPPPPPFSHHLAANFSLPKYFWPLFCRLKLSKPLSLSCSPRTPCVLLQYICHLARKWHLLCVFLSDLSATFLPVCLCFRFPPVTTVIICVCFSYFTSYSLFLFHHSSLNLASCFPCLPCVSYASSEHLIRSWASPPSPSVLLICFLSISIFLTLLPAPSYSFGICPSFLLSSFHGYIYVYTLSFSPPSSLLLNFL